MENRTNPHKPDKIATKRVNYKVKCIGKKECLPLDLQPGHIYQCVFEIIDVFQKGYLGIIDESGEAYVYTPRWFEKVD
jgi:hypothetical protein